MRVEKMVACNCALFGAWMQDIVSFTVHSFLLNRRGEHLVEYAVCKYDQYINPNLPIGVVVKVQNKLSLQGGREGG